MMTATVEQLAREVGGEVRGDGRRVMRGVAALTKAGPQELTFASDERHVRRLAESRAGACLVSRQHSDQLGASSAGPALVLVDDTLDAFLAILRRFQPQAPRPAPGISAAAHIDPTARLGAGCHVSAGAFIDAGAIIGARCEVYPGAYVGRDCRIGEECVLHPHAVLYSGVILGARVIVHAGAVLGADGFGYRFREGRFEKIPQLGGVEIGDDCEIGANSTIDRGMIGATLVGAGTKLDNLVMIGHNCEIGRHNAFASQVGLAGSTTTGDYVRCGGQAGVADHVHLGRGCSVGAGAGVHKDIPEGETHIGYPARPEQEQLRIVMAAGRLPEIRKQLRELQAQVAALMNQREQTAATDAAA